MSAGPSVKRVLLGRPIATAQELQERLSKKFALPVFASDAISSTAYATEEILLALVLGGSGRGHPCSSPSPSRSSSCWSSSRCRTSRRSTRTRTAEGPTSSAGRTSGLFPGLIAAALADGRLRHDRRGERGFGGGRHRRRPSPALVAYRIWICVGVIIILVALANLRGVSESATLLRRPHVRFRRPVRRARGRRRRPLGSRGAWSRSSRAARRRLCREPPCCGSSCGRSPAGARP